MIPLKDSNPCTCVPFVTIGLIAVNVAVFLYQASLGRELQGFVRAWGLVPAEVLGRPVTVLTSMFLHGGVVHVGGNMLYLWIFGDNIESAFGHLRFLGLYLVFGLAAAALHTAVDPGSGMPMVGASGAVAGVLGAYALLYPRARVLTAVFFGFFVRLVWIPAAFVLGLWFVLQLVSGLPALSRAGGGVAWFAHVGGFAAGLALALPLVRRVRAECAARERAARRRPTFRM